MDDLFILLLNITNWSYATQYCKFRNGRFYYYYYITIIYYRILDGIERDQRHEMGYGKIFDKESTKPNQKKGNCIGLLSNA